MKEVTDFVIVIVNYDELLSFLTVPSNRCGYMTMEEAILNGFTEKDYTKFFNRSLKIRKDIKREGWRKDSFFYICKDFNGNIYLLDGQGRRMALNIIRDTQKAFVNSLDFYCVFYTKPMTMEEMQEAVIKLNTGTHNWTTDDLFRSYSIQSNDQSVINAYYETKKIKEKLGVSDKTAKLLVFGEKASHLRSSNSGPLSEKDYSTTKDLFSETLGNIFDGLSYKNDKNGNKIPRSKEIFKKIRRDNFSTALITCFKKITRQCDNDPDLTKETLKYFGEAVVRAGSGFDDFVQQFTSLPKADYSLIAQQIKKNVKNNDLIKNALYPSEI